MTPTDWCMAHPYLTFFVALFLLGTLRRIFARRVVVVRACQDPTDATKNADGSKEGN